MTGDAEVPETPKGVDLRALAADWVTIVQSELAAMAADREAQETAQALLAVWAGAMAAAMRAAPREPGATGAAATTGAAPAAAASDAGGAELDELRRRVHELEARLAALVSGLGEPGQAKARRGFRPRCWRRRWRGIVRCWRGLRRIGGIRGSG